MNKKKSLVDQMLTFLEQTSSSSAEEEPNRRKNSQTSGVVQLSNSNANKNIVMVKKEKNFHRRIFNVLPQLGKNHIDIFFGFMGINEKAIQNPGYEQSYLYSFLQVRTIERVEVFEKAIILEMTQPSCQYEPPVEYFIEKYRSKGRLEYYQMSLIIEQLTGLLKSLGPPQAQTPQIIKKYLDQLGDNMYLGLFGPRKVVISKALLTYLNYDVEQLTVEATKYRSLLMEITSSLNYTEGIKTFLRFFKYTAQLNKGEITLEEYKELTTYYFCDFIYSKDHVSSLCEMRFYQLTPNYMIQQIDKIIYKEDGRRKSNRNLMLQNAIEEEKERIKQSEYKTLKKIKHLPKDLFKENQNRIAGYIQMEPQKRNQNDLAFKTEQ